jgi:hypothetical protein
MEFSSTKCKNGCNEAAAHPCSVCNNDYCYTCLKLQDKVPVCQSCVNKMSRKPGSIDLRIMAGVIGSGVIFLVYHLVHMIPPLH